MNSIIHQFTRFSGKTYPEDETRKMVTLTIKGHKRTAFQYHFEKCKDFLCPPETKIQEWFKTELDARLRCKALDPYGFMVTKNKWRQNGIFYFICSNENCHAKIVLKRIDPDDEGNCFGVYGCNSHQHPLPRFKKSEIVFRNKAEAQEFINDKLNKMYRVTTTAKKNKHFYRYYR